METKTYIHADWSVQEWCIKTHIPQFPTVCTWAERWLSGEDRTVESATAAMHTVRDAIRDLRNSMPHENALTTNHFGIYTQREAPMYAFLKNLRFGIAAAVAHAKRERGDFSRAALAEAQE